MVWACGKNAQAPYSQKAIRMSPVYGWCEGGLGQQRNEGGGCVSMRERSERVKSPDTYVTEWVSCCHFCLVLCFFGPPSRDLVVITWKGAGCCYMIGWDKRCQVYGPRGVCWWLCVLSDLTWLPHLAGGRKSWYIILKYRVRRCRVNIGRSPHSRVYSAVGLICWAYSIYVYSAVWLYVKVTA